MVKVLFIVIPCFKLKRAIQREPAGLFRKCLVSLELSKMSAFDLVGPWGLQWWVMKLVQWPLSRASWSRAAESWQGWGRKMLSTTFFRWYICWASFLQGHALRWLLAFFRVWSDSTRCWNQFRLWCAALFSFSKSRSWCFWVGWRFPQQHHFWQSGEEAPCLRVSPSSYSKLWWFSLDSPVHIGSDSSFSWFSLDSLLHISSDSSFSWFSLDWLVQQLARSTKFHGVALQQFPT